ncbi:cupin domain-containing protein [Lysobacter sp. Root494]|uniref:cupin domain-containing protein n=1 Tax=Lysobacter sp. Root494 TaxID=1736549 RepID=UPI0009EA8FE3|nr:cupin domain-containing protein [Lysobacter sp. Root494]
MGRLEAVPVSTLQASRIDDVPAVRIGAGCMRRDLSSDGSVRVWVVDMEPGSIWPYVDDHDTGEYYYVIEGEVIEGSKRYGAGTYVRFLPGTSHRPRTDTGVRLFGFNLDPAAMSAAREATSRTHRFNYSQG